jgi:hypothetical protein
MTILYSTLYLSNTGTKLGQTNMCNKAEQLKLCSNVIPIPLFLAMQGGILLALDAFPVEGPTSLVLSIRLPKLRHSFRSGASILTLLDNLNSALRPGRTVCHHVTLAFIINRWYAMVLLLTPLIDIRLRQPK